MAARSAGTLATASRPSTALSTPVANPATNNDGSSRHGDEPVSIPRASSCPIPTTSSAIAIRFGPESGILNLRSSNEASTLVTDQPATSQVATHSESPNPTWTRNGTLDVIPMMPMPTTSAPTVAARKPGERSSPRSSMGSAVRLSTSTNPTNSNALSPTAHRFPSRCRSGLGSAH